MLRSILTLKSTSTYRLLVCTRLHYSSKEIFQDLRELDVDLYEALKKTSANKEKISQEPSKRDELVEKFKKTFGCKLQKAKDTVTKNEVLLGQPMKQITENLEILARKHIKTEVIMENVWLLSFPSAELNMKFELIQKLKPRNINDFLPLARLSTLQLMEIRKKFMKEEAEFKGGNRIYYISEQLKIEPAQVSTRIVKNVATLKTLKMSTEKLYLNIKVLREQELPAAIILSNLHKNIGIISEICVPNVKGYDAVVEYLSERLGYDIEKTKQMICQITFFIDRGLSVNKVKKVLDYLMIEENYEPNQIATSILIVSKSVETIKKRLDDFKSLGMRPSSLGCLCKSQKEYELYLERVKSRL